MPSGHATIALLLAILIAAACNRSGQVHHQEGTGHLLLKPLANPERHVARLRQLVYVPVYSSMYWGFDRQSMELAATLSIRNVSSKHTLVIHSVKYHDSAGKEIREYVPKLSALAPMATADFVIQRLDTTGGPGANFLVDWSSTADIDEPVIEAVMIGQYGNAGVSFSSWGRPLPKASAELSDPSASQH